MASYDRDNEDDDGYGARPTKKEARGPQKVLGGFFEVTPAMAPMVNLAEGLALQYGSPKIEEWTREHAPKLINKFLKKEAHQKFAKGAVAELAANSLVFYDPLLGLARGAFDLKRGMRELSDALAPLSAANNHGKGIVHLVHGDLSHNEVVQDATHRLTARWNNNISGMGLKALTLLPITLTNKYESYLKSNHEKFVRDLAPGLEEDLREAEAVKDTKEARRIRKELQDNETAGSNNLNILKTGVTPAISTLGQEMAARSREEMRQANGILPFDMIQELSRQVKASPGSDSIETQADGQVAIQDFVRQIFNLHQKKRHEPAIGQRFEKQFGYACESISKEIVAGRLNPLALVNLVGDRKIVLKGGKRFATHQDVDKLIAAQENKLTVSDGVSAKEYYQESPLSQEETKALLHSLKPPLRDFFIATHNEEAMHEIGVEEREFQKAHQAVGNFLPDFIGKAILKISKHPEAQLAGSGRDTEQEIEQLREAGEDIKERGLAAVEDRMSKPGDYKGLEYLVANDKTFWEKEAESVANDHHRLPGSAKGRTASRTRPEDYNDYEAPSRRAANDEREYGENRSRSEDYNDYDRQPPRSRLAANDEEGRDYQGRHAAGGRAL